MLQQRIKKNILLFTTMLSASLIFLFSIISVGVTRIAALPDYDLVNQMNKSVETKTKYTVSLALYKIRSTTEAKHGRSAHNDIENLYSNIYGNFLGISSWAEENIEEFEKITDIDDTKTLQPLINQSAVYLINNVVAKLKADTEDYSDYKTYIDEMTTTTINKEVSSAISNLWYSES